MTREEAVAEAARLGRESPERTTHSWLVREPVPGDWRGVRVGLPTRGPVKEAQEARPKPPSADDPRPPMWRDVGGPYGPG